ncbi:MAG: lysylphosphatidylglycerol synthase domain-containing protein [Desulfobulbaceae bacterium]|jgi:uncharacterized protein (TIRG00374 family)|nr:lysylphosphatidylglycerol synthase domain-containing protein [Desulfobulbaceae bacterium]
MTGFHLLNRKSLFFALSLLVSAGAFLYLRQTVSFSELSDLIRQIPVSGLALFVAFSLTMSCFRAWRYLLLLRASGYQAARLPLFLITLARNFFSDLLPARLGDLMFIYLARNRLGVSVSAASACFAWCFVFDVISLGFLIAIATIFALGSGIHPAVLLAAGLLLALACSLLLRSLPLLIRCGESVARALPRLFLRQAGRERLRQALAALGDELVKLQKGGLYWPVLVLSLGTRLGKYLTLYSLFVALVAPLGYGLADLPPAKVFFGLAAAELAASLPISGIAGFGAYEGAWSLVFQLLGYPEKVAALTGVSHHLLTQVYGYALGALAFLLLLLPWRRPGLLIEQSFGPFFYARALMLAALPLCLAALVVSHQPGLAVERVAPLGARLEASTVAPSAPPAGRLVFQRTSGLFVFDTATGTEKRLRASGHYPRWSPDGSRIAFLDGDGLWLINADGGEAKMALRQTGLRALAFVADEAILFSDGRGIKTFDPRSGRVAIVYADGDFLELDGDGARLVGTEKIFGGYRVATIEAATGVSRIVAKGCSASLSADSRLISVNGGNHRRLYLYDSKSLAPSATLAMIAGKKFDNQFFSNHPDWLASRSEGDDEGVFLHHLPSGAGFRLSVSGGCDRPDFFVVQ